MRAVRLGHGLFLLAVSLALGLLLVACDGDKETQPPAEEETSEARHEGSPVVTVAQEEPEEIGGDAPKEGETDPCSLVTKGEVEEILEQPVGDIYRHWRPTVLCEYFTEEDPFGSATIRLDAGVSQAEFQEEVELAEVLGGSEAEEVSGIGDAAFAAGPLLYVYKEETLLLVVVAVREAPDLDAAKELALIALQRLP
jgi:hypothetical protein